MRESKRCCCTRIGLARGLRGGTAVQQVPCFDRYLLNTLASQQSGYLADVCLPTYQVISNI